MRTIKRLIKQFKNWMDYNPPGALTSKGWRLFKDEFKRNAPVRYWIKNTLRYKYYLPITWKYKAVKEWVRYRTYDRYHVVKTGLPPGYVGVEQQLLHSSFNLLKDFVEVELAWHTYAWSDERKKSGFFERHFTFIYRLLNPFRSREWAMKYFDWASTLDDPNLPPHERCDHQARDAREIRELYLWWVDKRPTRKEFETPEYSDQGLGIMSSLDDDFDRNAEDFKAFSNVMAQNEDLNKQWDEEDTEMFIRLIKVRKSLWT